MIWSELSSSSAISTSGCWWWKPASRRGRFTAGDATDGTVATVTWPRSRPGELVDSVADRRDGRERGAGVGKHGGTDRGRAHAAG